MVTVQDCFCSFIQLLSFSLAVFSTTTLEGWTLKEEAHLQATSKGFQLFWVLSGWDYWMLDLFEWKFCFATFIVPYIKDSKATNQRWILISYHKQFRNLGNGLALASIYATFGFQERTSFELLCTPDSVKLSEIVAEATENLLIVNSEPVLNSNCIYKLMETVLS